MTTEQLPTKEKAGCLAYTIGIASFIPLIGVIFGIIAIIWGIAKRAWPIALLGVAGILFTVILYSSLFYFGFHQRGGVYDKLRSQLAVTLLNNTVKEIEYYKLQNGHYPATLKDLETKDATKLPFFPYDPTAIERNDPMNTYFYYELDASGTFYYLRSVGPDGIPFTPDDILPTLTEEERKHTGLKLER